MKQLSRDLIVCLICAWLVLSSPGAGAASFGSQAQTNSASDSQTDPPGDEDPASSDPDESEPEPPESDPGESPGGSGAADTPDTRSPRSPGSDPGGGEPRSGSGSGATTTDQADSDSQSEDDASDEDGEEDRDQTETVVDVDDAVLRWGINNESNTKAFAPGTFNFLSAGKLGNPGQGAQLLPPRSDGSKWLNGKRAGWSAASGNVSLEKWNGSAYRPATFAGTSTDAAGQMLRFGTFSEHQLVFSKGEGTVDLEAKDAEISWDGDATILYYSGYVFFYLSDPTLVVDAGKGKVTAELGGYATSMQDMAKWEPMKPTEVTLADLGDVELNESGFTAQPKFEGVRISGDGISQVAPFGSFPQSFIDFQNLLGTAGFWYTSGGSADRFKPPLPMTFAWQGNAAKPPAPPETGPPPADIQNSAPKLPAPGRATNVVQNIVNTVAGLGTAAGALAATVPASVPASAPLEKASTAQASAELAGISSVDPLATKSATVNSGSASAAPWWIATCLFVVLAALCLVTSASFTRRRAPNL